MECAAGHKFEVEQKFVNFIPDGIKLKKNGKSRAKYALDFSRPELRDVSNWKVKSHNSKPHKEEGRLLYPHSEKVPRSSQNWHLIPYNVMLIRH